VSPRPLGLELDLRRIWLTGASTVGQLYVNGEFEAYVLEDRYRPPPEPKVRGATCIPNGRYEVIINHSPRFNRDLPLLLNVPDFSGVRIHPGNTAADTEGCLLPGLIRHGESVLESRRAFDSLFAKLKESKGSNFINIMLDVEHYPERNT
jgi:hypothetical protein